MENFSRFADRDFFDRPSPLVARELLGMPLVRVLPDGTTLAGIVVETEAYLHDSDPAAHGARGRTRANASLFGESGRLYVHPMRQYCGMDVVTEPADIPSSVLLRAIVPVAGIGHMMESRHKSDTAGLADGPGKLCRALGIDRSFDGADLLAPDSPIFLSSKRSGISDADIGVSRRIGIDKAADLELRFFLRPYVRR